MIDLQKEFRTLRLLAYALLIIGGGLAIGGFGIALMTRDATKTARPDQQVTPRDPDDATVAEADPPPAVPKKNDTQKLTTYTSQITFNTGLMGVLFIGLGWTLRWIIRNNIDDDDDKGEVQMSDDLFKAYADQIALAEKMKQTNRKKMKLDL